MRSCCSIGSCGKGRVDSTISAHRRRLITVGGGAGLLHCPLPPCAFNGASRCTNGEPFDMADFPALPLWTDAFLADTNNLSTEETGAYLLLLMSAWRTSTCTLPDNDIQLARMARVGRKKWARIRPVMMQFFDVSDGVWYQKRLLKERDRVAKKRNKCVDAANRRWNRSNVPFASAGKAKTVSYEHHSGSSNVLNLHKTDDANAYANAMPPYPYPYIERVSNGEGSPESGELFAIQTQQPPPTPPKRGGDRLEGFEEFWKAGTEGLGSAFRRGDKGGAKKAYAKVDPDDREALKRAAVNRRRALAYLRDLEKERGDGLGVEVCSKLKYWQGWISSEEWRDWVDDVSGDFKLKLREQRQRFEARAAARRRQEQDLRRRENWESGA